MKDSRLPWSWRAWFASAAVMGLMAIPAVIFSAVVEFAATGHLGADGANDDQADGGGLLGLAAAFGLLILIGGTASALWILLPLFVAKMTSRPALWFPAFAPALPALRWILSRSDATQAQADVALAVWLPTVSTSNWAMLIVLIVTHLVGALTYLFVVRTVKPPA